eukprot:COSAG01_NODE_1445_length_10281_cov_33.445099_1_plen_52_part_10
MEYHPLYKLTVAHDQKACDFLTLRPVRCGTVNYKSIGPRVCHASSAAWLQPL